MIIQYCFIKEKNKINPCTSILFKSDKKYVLFSRRLFYLSVIFGLEFIKNSRNGNCYLEAEREGEKAFSLCTG